MFSNLNKDHNELLNNDQVLKPTKVHTSNLQSKLITISSTHLKEMELNFFKVWHTKINLIIDLINQQNNVSNLLSLNGISEKNESGLLAFITHLKA